MKRVLSFETDWQRPLGPFSAAAAGGGGGGTGTSTARSSSYATYARILSLFLDTPDASSPFSVHKFAREGERLGKRVGEWFGPSTASGAITRLVHQYEPSRVRVVSCVDGTLYENEVKAAAAARRGGDEWDRHVLVLINLRLGIDGVNPIYHEAIKVSLFSYSAKNTHRKKVCETKYKTSALLRPSFDCLNRSGSRAGDPRHRTTSLAPRQTRSSTSTLTTRDRPCLPSRSRANSNRSTRRSLCRRRLRASSRTKGTWTRRNG